MMETVGPPRAIDASVEAIEEVEALDAVATDELRDLWARLPKHGQQLWLSMLVARTRALRESASAPRETLDRAKIVVARYPAWAKKHVPGHVMACSSDTHLCAVPGRRTGATTGMHSANCSATREEWRPPRQLREGDIRDPITSTTTTARISTPRGAFFPSCAA
jgi:hypothetical protein